MERRFPFGSLVPSTFFLSKSLSNSTNYQNERGYPQLWHNVGKEGSKEGRKEETKEGKKEIRKEGRKQGRKEAREGG